MLIFIPHIAHNFSFDTFLLFTDQELNLIFLKLKRNWIWWSQNTNRRPTFRRHFCGAKYRRAYNKLHSSR